MHTCIHAYMHTYIHTYVHTYIHTYIHMGNCDTSVMTPFVLALSGSCRKPQNCDAEAVAIYLYIHTYMIYDDMMHLCLQI